MEKLSRSFSDYFDPPRLGRLSTTCHPNIPPVQPGVRTYIEHFAAWTFRYARFQSLTDLCSLDAQLPIVRHLRLWDVDNGKA